MTRQPLYKSLYIQVLVAIAIAIAIGIDRFMSEVRALTNLIGNGVASVVVAKWCGQLDQEQLQRELANPSRSAVELPLVAEPVELTADAARR